MCIANLSLNTLYSCCGIEATITCLHCKMRVHYEAKIAPLQPLHNIISHFRRHAFTCLSWCCHFRFLWKHFASFIFPEWRHTPCIEIKGGMEGGKQKTWINFEYTSNTLIALLEDRMKRFWIIFEYCFKFRRNVESLYGTRSLKTYVKIINLSL